MFDLDTLTGNILDVYRGATDAQRAEGLAWYDRALDFAHTLSGRYGISTEQAAGVLAVLSPQTEWGHNKRWAERVCFAHSLGLPLPKQGLGNSLRRARLVLAGDLSDVEREDGTLKVNRFWRSILGRPGVATIDRHALRVALGDLYGNPPALTDNRYRLVERAYLDAGREVRLAGRRIQAVTWLACLDARNSVAAS